MPSRLTLPQQLFRIPEWKRIRSYCADWKQLVLDDATEVDETGLEFDIHGRPPSEPTPCFYFSSRHKDGLKYKTIIDTLHELWDRPVTPELQHNIRQSLEQLPAGGRVFFSRPDVGTAGV